MVLIILNKIKYYLFLCLIIFFSCYNFFSNPFNDLSKAFNNWYIQHHPNRFNLVNPDIIYEKNKFGENTYINEYLFDLKRFKLELLQISKNNLNRDNQYKYNSIIDIIDRLIYENIKLQEYNWNLSYYSNIAYKHFSNLLFHDKISDNQIFLSYENSKKLLISIFNIKTGKNIKKIEILK